MVLGEIWPKVNGSKKGSNPVKTIQGSIPGYNSPRKTVKLPKTFPSKSAQKWKKA